MARPEPVVILCGGRGTRLQQRDRDLPKPLVEIGGRPIVEHVVRLYAAQGFAEVLLATGHRAAEIARFAADCDWPHGLQVTAVDTGVDTPTGGRVHRLAERLAGRRFCLTYADGVADVDLGALVEAHAAHGALATVTVVRPELQFGVALLADDDRVVGFDEKPRSEHWVNGGFLVLEPGALAYIQDDSVLERGPLGALAADGQLRAFRHDGFWDCLDTYKDALLLNDLWEAGRAPWASGALR